MKNNPRSMAQILALSVTRYGIAATDRFRAFSEDATC
jgi:hypothetical protein